MYKLLVHDFVPRSSANGPGVRSVIWVQGCNLGCRGCINPATHIPLSADPTKQMSVDDILAMVPEDVEGITLSGGEPLQQDLDSIYYLITQAKARGLTVAMFTGYNVVELFTLSDTGMGIKIYSLCDLIISGRYRYDLPPEDATPLLASSNQTLLFPTERYSKKDLQDVPSLELIFDMENNRTVKTGVNKGVNK